MGAAGEDVLLSPAARKVWPFYTEVKNVEALNIHKALAQASGKGRTPLVVFRKNNTPLYAALPFDVFLELVRKAHVYDNLTAVKKPAPAEPFVPWNA